MPDLTVMPTPQLIGLAVGINRNFDARVEKAKRQIATDLLVDESKVLAELERRVEEVDGNRCQTVWRADAGLCDGAGSRDHRHA